MQNVQSTENLATHPAIKALQEFQQAMSGEAERSGLDTEEKIVEFVKGVRREIVP